MNTSFQDKQTPIFHTKEKQGQDLENTKRKRDEYLLDIRKKKREQALSKKRNLNSEISTMFSQNQIKQDIREMINDEDLQGHIAEWQASEFTKQDLEKIVEACQSDHIYNHYYAAIGLRKLLSTDRESIQNPTQEILDKGLLNAIIRFVNSDQHPYLKLEGAMSLTNIAFGQPEHLVWVIEQDGIQEFIKLFDSKYAQIITQGIKGLGNISIESTKLRNEMIQLGAIDKIVYAIENIKSSETTKLGVWALGNIIRSQPYPSFEQVKSTINVFSLILQKETDVEIIVDTIWTVMAISYTSQENIDLLIHKDIIKGVVRQLESEHQVIIMAALKALGNILTGSEEQINSVLKFNNLMKLLTNLLDVKQRALRRDTVICLGNICAGTADQVDFVIGNAGRLKTLFDLAKKDDGEVKREISCLIRNATNNQVKQNIQVLLNAGCLETLEVLLGVFDSQTIVYALEAIENILDWASKLFNESGDDMVLTQLKSELDRLEIVQKVEKLTVHPINTVEKKSSEVIDKYFSE